MKNNSNLKHKHIKSVGFACDFFRFNVSGNRIESMQLRNMMWLQNLLGIEDICKANGVPFTTITTPGSYDDCKRALQDDNLFEQYIHDPEGAWATQYDNAQCKAFPSLLRALTSHDLIVGFELPPTLKTCIAKAGRFYISVHIHPLRFLRDLCFTVYSNMPRALELVKECLVPQLEIDSQVRKFKAKFTRDQHPAFSIIPNAPVLIGQTEKDSVLLNDGKFATWPDYHEALVAKLKDHDTVVFMGHPARGNNHDIIEYLRSNLNKTVITPQTNSYGVLFSNDSVPFYLTLASSFGVEAKAAGFVSEFLLDDPRSKFVSSSSDTCIEGATSHHFLSESLWADILGIPAKRSSDADNVNAFYLGDNYLRDSLDGWSYNALRNPMQLGWARKTVYPSAKCNLAQFRDLVTKLDGVIPVGTMVSDFYQQAWGELIVSPSPLQPNEASLLVFDNVSKKQLLREGFHDSESWGTWSNSTYAKVVLPIALTDNKPVQVDIAIALQVFEPLKQHAPALQLVCNGHEIGWLLLRNDSDTKADLLFSTILVDNTCTLEFRISHADTPARCFGSADVRVLSFGLISCSVRASEANMNAPSAAYPLFWGVAPKDIFNNN